MQQIFGKSQIALRKLMGKNGTLTAGDLKKDGAIANLVHLNVDYRVLRTVRGSPPYFEQAKKKRPFCPDSSAWASNIVPKLFCCRHTMGSSSKYSVEGSRWS